METQIERLERLGIELKQKEETINRRYAEIDYHLYEIAEVRKSITELRKEGDNVREKIRGIREV